MNSSQLNSRSTTFGPFFLAGGRRLATSLLAGVLALGLLAAAAGTSIACTCGPDWPTPQEEFEQSAAVFTGRVLSMEPLPFGAADVEIQVYLGWKGITGSRMIAYNPSGSMCGYPFEVGHEYLVYARGAPESLSTGQCGRTTAIESAGEDLEALGPPTVVSADKSKWGTLKARYDGD